MVKESLNKNVEIFDAVCVRGIREYKIKKKQFLESSGIVTIEESSGLLISCAIISGKNSMKDVTDVIKEHVGQVKCPLDIIYIDTGKLNEFTGHDVEPGTQKLLQIEYITDDTTSHDRQVCCPTSRCKKKHNHQNCSSESSNDTTHHCKKKHDHKKCNSESSNDTTHHCSTIGIDATKNIYLDNIKPKCNKKKKKHRCCSNKQVESCSRKINMNKRLIIPLFPIHSAYVCPLLTDQERNHNNHFNQHNQHNHYKCNCVGQCTC